MVKIEHSKKIIILLSFSIIMFVQDVIAQESSKMMFWETQRKGANGYMKNNKPEWFIAASNEKFDFIRLNVSMTNIF